MRRWAFSVAVVLVLLASLYRQAEINYQVAMELQAIREAQVSVDYSRYSREKGI